MMTREVAALQDEVRRLLELSYRYEALLREALQWCPRVPTHPTSAKRQAVGDGWCDLGNRIEAALAETAVLTEGPN